MALSSYADFYTYSTTQLNVDDGFYRVYYWSSLDDQTETFYGSAKIFPVDFRYSAYDITQWNTDNPSHIIDYMNLTCTHDINLWDNGEIVNYSRVVVSFRFNVSNTPVGTQTLNFEMHNKDYIFCIGDVFYSGAPLENDQAFGSTAFIVPSMDCKACSDFSYKELVMQEEVKEQSFSKQTSIYNYVMGFIALNYEFYLIFFWLFKIIVVIGAISLIILAVFWFYYFVKAVSNS